MLVRETIFISGIPSSDEHLQDFRAFLSIYPYYIAFILPRFNSYGLIHRG